MSEPRVAPTRADAWALLCEWTPSEPLRRHGLAVEATVAWYGEHHFGVSGSELETWRAAGLLHDFDYERYPETHPVRGAEELRRLGYPDDVVEAVLGHGDHTGVPRTSPLARTVYACDEMSRQIPRDQLEKGAAELGVSLEAHISNVVEGLKTIRSELGL